MKCISLLLATLLTCVAAQAEVVNIRGSRANELLDALMAANLMTYPMPDENGFVRAGAYTGFECSRNPAQSFEYMEYNWQCYLPGFGVPGAVGTEMRNSLALKWAIERYAKRRDVRPYEVLYVNKVTCSLELATKKYSCEIIK